MSTDASTIYTTGYVMSNNSVETPPMQYVSTSSSTSATGKDRIIVLLMVFIRLIDNWAILFLVIYFQDMRLTWSI